MKHFSLSRISLALTFVYVSLPVMAEIQSANQQTQVGRQGAVEVINIAQPTAAGLSHNQYQKFNVDKAGAVLNNAQSGGRSELAGQLNANPNLRQSSASVILNEVVSRNPSTIAGQQEIFGQRADYVLANPNGISVQGGGFINTAKASLVVGKPTVQNGALSGFDVSGSNVLNTQGKLNSTLEQLDLVAPVVNIEGAVEGVREVNVIGGKNKLERNSDGQLKINVQKATGTVLDGKVVGSIYSDRIRIHSTDERATLTVSGADLKAQDSVISAANAQFSGKVETKIQNSDRNYKADKNVKVQEYRSEKSEGVQRTKINSDRLVIDTANNLNFSATDIHTKQALISGGQTHLGGQMTTDSVVSTNNKSKGAWYRNDSNTSSTQTFHRTNIVADDLTLIANKGRLSGEAAKIDVKNALLFAENGVDLKGKNQRNQKNLESNYRNETAKLKTGRNYANVDEEAFVASELNVAENLRIGGRGDVQLTAVTGNINGNMLVESSDKVIFGSQSSRVIKDIDDNEKYWGGIGGSNSGKALTNELVQHGSDIQIKNLAYVAANNGVQISGSRVLAGEGYVSSNQGKLAIDSVNAQSSAQVASRKGTIFNITKSRNEAFSSVTTVQGSTLKSDANLHLLSNDQIDVIGSKVVASGVLNVAAKQINVAGTQSSSESGSSSYQFGFSKKVEKDKSKMNIEGLVNEVIDTWLDGRMIESPLKLFWDHRVHRKALSVTLGSQKESEKVNEISHTASQLLGSGVAVNTEKLSLKGSQMAATNGNVVVNAQSIQTSAQKNSKQTDRKEQSIGLTAGIDISNKGIKNYLTLGGQSAKAMTKTETAQRSEISATENVELNAKRIIHQGSSLVAQKGDVVENAENIRHEAAQTQNIENKQNVNVGITASVHVDKKLHHTYGIEVIAQGGRENSLANENTLTTVQGGRNILVSGEQITDVGTQYQAVNNVQLTSNDHRIQSALSSKHTDKMSAGSKLGIAAETNGDNSGSFSLKVNVGANYQQAQSVATSVQQANVQGKNVLISTENLNGSANIAAEETAHLNAQNSLNFTQSTETSRKNGGGFNADLAVGGITKGTAVIPSVDISLSANGEKGQSQSAVTNTISGKKVIVQSGGKNHLQGTNINAEIAEISGQSVHVAAAENYNSLNSGSAGVSVGIGKGVSSVKADGKFSVNVEKETVYTATTINANTLAVNSLNGIRFDGVQATGDNVSLDSGNGNLSLNALKNHKQKTGVAASLALNGDVKDKQWNAKGGSASLDVNIVRNDTHTTSTMNANNLNLNVNGNAWFNGSVIYANQVNGTVTGNVVSTAATDKINETAVSLSASGSGKYTPYPTVKLPLALKKDWDNGAIAGIKGDASYSVAVTRKQRGLPTGLISANNHLNVGGQTITAATSATGGYSYTTQGSLTTNLKQRYYLPWRAKQFGQ